MKNNGNIMEITPSFIRGFKPEMQRAKVRYLTRSPRAGFWTAESRSQMIRLLKESSQPVERVPIDPKRSRVQYKLPILCVDPDSHTMRADKDDWRIYAYLNQKNGDFFQYFFFEKELDYEWPLYMRNFALDYLAGVNQCKRSTTGVTLNSKVKVITFSTQNIFDPKKIVLALDDSKKPWRPKPLPLDKNTIPTNRLFYRDTPGRIFGSYSKVWELGIWERLGMTFKLSPKAEIYLCGYGTLLQAAETQTVAEEHALIKKCGVIITAERYAELEKIK